MIASTLQIRLEPPFQFCVAFENSSCASCNASLAFSTFAPTPCALSSLPPA